MPTASQPTRVLIVLPSFPVDFGEPQPRPWLFGVIRSSGTFLSPVTDDGRTQVDNLVSREFDWIVLINVDDPHDLKLPPSTSTTRPTQARQLHLMAGETSEWASAEVVGADLATPAGCGPSLRWVCSSKRLDLPWSERRSFQAFSSLPPCTDLPVPFASTFELLWSWHVWVRVWMRRRCLAETESLTGAAPMSRMCPWVERGRPGTRNHKPKT